MDKLIKIIIIMSMLVIHGCKIATNADEMMRLIDSCEKRYREPCQFQPIPESHGDEEMGALYQKWDL